jgi:hypothetical protein
LYADPQSITLDAGATSFPRIGAGINTGRFRSASGLTKYDGTGEVFDLSIDHSYTKQRVRSVARLDATVHATNLLGPSGVLVGEGYSVYLVYDRPIAPSGIASAADQLDFVASFTTWLTASTNAATVKLINGES